MQVKNFKKAKKANEAVMLAVTWSSFILSFIMGVYMFTKGISNFYGWGVCAFGTAVGLFSGFAIPYLAYLLWWRLFTATGRRTERLQTLPVKH